MLVLRRKVEEALVIDGVITVTVLAVEGERVKLGITAPPDVAVVREELLDFAEQQRTLRQKQAALLQENDPQKRERLEQGIARLQQSLPLVSASPKAREEQRPLQRRDALFTRRKGEPNGDLAE